MSKDVFGDMEPDVLEQEFAGVAKSALVKPRTPKPPAVSAPQKPPRASTTPPAEGRICAPGIYSGMPMATYLADPVQVPSFSSSIAITLLQKSPMHAFAAHPRNPKCIARDGSKEASIGTIAHELLLEGTADKLCEIDPEQYPGKRGGIPDGWTNDAIRAARDEAIANGQVPLLKKHAQVCRHMVDAAREYISRCEIAAAFKNGEAELTVVSQEGAVWLRSRPDLLTHDREICVHLKTTAASAKPSKFGRGLLRSMGYDVALAFYARVIAGANDGAGPLRNVILVQEQDPPYACSLVGMTDEYEALASRLVNTAIQTWGNCMKTNRWPGYGYRVEYIKHPTWMELEIDEDEVRTFMGGQMDPEQARHGLQV